MSDTPEIKWDSDAGFEDEEEGPQSPSEAGPYAENYDHSKRPRRVQTNVKIADEVKQEFKQEVKDANQEMQFVIEDLLRLYLKDRRS
jgi:hypothetical protein